jgi:hypothetical protein
MRTIYATFATESEAEKAAGALLDHGITGTEISFILPGGGEPARSPYAGAPIPTPPTSGTLANAPASTPVTLPSDIPVYDVPLPDTVASVNAPSRKIQTGPEPGSSYRYDPLRPSVPNPSMAQATIPRPDVPPIAANTPIDVVEHDSRHIVDMNRELPEAASGITTTTGADAAKGAAEGGAIGLGLGLLLGLAAVAVPGIGWVAGAGALVAGLTAATGVAGGIAGGVYGYLKDMGIPQHVARRLSDHLETGGPILSVTVSGVVTEGEVITLLKKYGATSAEAF